MNRDLLERDVDAAGKRISNLLLPVLGTEPMRLQDVAVGAGILKSTGVNQAPLVLAEAGVDYQDFIVAGNGIRIPDGKTINNTLVEGLGNRQTAIGAEEEAGNLFLRSTSHPSKGAIIFGDSDGPVGILGFADEQSNTWCLGSNVLGAVLAARVHMRAPAGGTSALFNDVDGLGTMVISHPSSGVARVTGHTGVALKLGSNAVADRVVLDTAGHVTFTDLAGAGTALTRVTSAGLFERAVGGVDYQLPIAAGTGIRIPDGFTIFARISEGVAGGQSAIGGQSASDNLTLSTTTNATKGIFVFGSTAVATLNESTKNFAVGAVYNGTLGGRLQVTGAGTGTSATFTDGSASAVLVSHPSSAVAAIAAPSAVALNLGAGGTTTYLQIATGGGVTLTNLSGGTTALVRASTAGLLERAVAGTDFVAPWSLTNRSVVVSAGGSTLTEDNNNFVYDTTNHRLILALGAAYSQAAGAPLTISGSTSSAAILLNQASAQAINKSGGTLAIGSTDTSAVQIKTNATTRASWDGTTGLLTLSADVAMTASGTSSISKSNGALVFGTDGSDSLLLKTGASAKLTIDGTTGGLTASSLAGVGSTLVKVSAAGLLSRGVAGTDFLAAPSFTAGSVIFSGGNGSGGAGGILLEDNTNLFFDDATNTLSVGVNSTLSATQIKAPGGSTGSPGLAVGVTGTGLWRDSGAGGRVVVAVGGTDRIYIGGPSGASSDIQLDTVTFSFGAGDIVLQREAQGFLAQRLTTVKQGFAVYNTWTSGTNYERGVIDWTTSANILTIGSQVGGGGGTLRKVFMVGTNVQVPAGTTSDPGIAIGDNHTGFRFDATNDGVIYVGDSTDLIHFGRNDQSDIRVNQLTLDYSNADVVLLRDAANVAALRRTTNAQGLRVYGTFTSSTNFERGNFSWVSSELNVGTEKGSGGGTDRWVRATGAGWNFFANAGTFSAPTKIGINLATNYANVDGNTLDAFSIPTTTVTVTGSTATNTLAAGVNLLSIGAPNYNGGGTTQTITNAATLDIGGPPVGVSGVTITNSHALRVRSGRAQFDDQIRVANNIILGNQSTTGGWFNSQTSEIRVLSPTGGTQIAAFNSSIPAVTLSARLRFLSSITPTAAGDVGMDTSTGRPRVFSGGMAGTSVGDQPAALAGDIHQIFAMKLFLGSAGDPTLPASFLGGTNAVFNTTNQLKVKPALSGITSFSYVVVSIRTIENSMNGTLNVRILKNGTLSATSSDISSSSLAEVSTQLNSLFGASDDLSFQIGGTATSGSALITVAMHIFG